MTLNNLKTLRKENNKTQSDLAKILNVTTGSYNQYELGNTEPNIDILIKLADYYGVSVDYLIGHNFYNELGYLTEEQKNFVQTFLGLNPANQTKAVIYVAGLLLNQ